jgi:PPOX class probable F420-dependent enzyme
MHEGRDVVGGGERAARWNGQSDVHDGISLGLWLGQGVMLTDRQRRFLAGQRVARLATADAAGRPHVVPICYALRGNTVYFTIDEKPKKRPGARLKRLANLRENPSAALVVDRYDEDWSRLGWVMVQGRAEVLEAGPEHDLAQVSLRARYPQLVTMRIEELPVVAVRLDHVVSWGRLEDD